MVSGRGPPLAGTGYPERSANGAARALEGIQSRKRTTGDARCAAPTSLPAPGSLSGVGGKSRLPPPRQPSARDSRSSNCAASA
jgi:hypothetical protein